LEYAIGDSNYQILESALMDQTYTAISLTPGIIYKFKVASRNLIGYSSFSEEVAILAA
jgi:hypothetical protein